MPGVGQDAADAEGIVDRQGRASSPGGRLAVCCSHCMARVTECRHCCRATAAADLVPALFDTAGVYTAGIDRNGVVGSSSP